MGSFSHVTFANYPIFENKNGYYLEIINSLFQSEDFICEKRKNSLRNNLVWGDIFKNDKRSYFFKGFRQSVRVCKERLEIYGASYKKAKNDFLQAKKKSKIEGIYDFSLSSFTYDQYLIHIKRIIDSKEKSYNGLNTSNLNESLLSNSLGIYGFTLQSQLYSILYVLSDNDYVEYDFTEIIDNGWVEISEAKKVIYEKIIVLAEGKTDVEFISKSIEKLYPHLRDYYHFIDFDEYKVEGSASALVKLVNSFAASNVKHPIIALFDNDTTGLKEMKKLISKTIPCNIKILKYPDIDIAKKYPTVGPTGEKKMNVNGLACSIEMYFGNDVLTKNNKLIPVRWKSFDEKEKKYQGEIADKNYVQESFRIKLECAELNESKEINELINVIFDAFK